MSSISNHDDICLRIEGGRVVVDDLPYVFWLEVSHDELEGQHRSRV
jgi:hypothetical protein